MRRRTSGAKRRALGCARFACALVAIGCGAATPAPPPATSPGEPAPVVSTPAPRGPFGDPVALWPDIYRVLLENEYVRVLDIRMKPGERDDWHGHPASAGYVLAPAKLRAYASDGTFKDVDAQAGMAAAHPPIEAHRMQNIGATEARVLFVERKDEPPRLSDPYLDAASADPGVYRVVAENEWFRVIEIRGAPGVEGALHSHPASVVYALEDGHVLHTVPGQAPVEQTLPAGKAVYVPGVAKHTMKNLGTTPTRVVMFELK